MSAQDVEARLVGALDGLEATEITAQDLDDFRRKLPTDPHLARLVNVWLPAPWNDVFEYVSASGGQTAYWRTVPERRRARSPAEHERNDRFREAARQAEGVRGTVDHDGKEIPASAAITADVVAGPTSRPRRVAESGRKALRRLRAVLNLHS